MEAEEEQPAQVNQPILLDAQNRGQKEGLLAFQPGP